jgi:hypothetical protein
MIWPVLVYGSGSSDEAARRRQRSERFALVVLLVGAVLSVGLFFGFKNRPGAYQGSPAYYMDPSQQDKAFRLDRIPVPKNAPTAPADPDDLRAALTDYARALAGLLDGIYILDRNYNYHFHNELFLRSTPLLADYRNAGLSRIREAAKIRATADEAAARVRSTLTAGDPAAALLDDVAAYTSFSFERAALLERMTADFERTKAGLQHATHIYEGEGKVLGVRLSELLMKHNAVLSSPAVAPLASDFVRISRGVYDKYANRIVGF